VERLSIWSIYVATEETAMNMRVIVDELDNMIDRAETEKGIHRTRIEAMPMSSARESDERLLRQMDLHLYRLRCYRSGLVAIRLVGSRLQ
jgi:hypothetical protein